jgi:hypothetical protein
MVGAAETSISKEFYEEPFKTKTSITPDMIWSDGSLIPTSAPTPGIISNTMINGELLSVWSDGVVRYHEKLILNRINDSCFSHPQLKDAIAFNFDENGSYRYELEDSLGRSIAFGVGDWIVDTHAGILKFYGNISKFSIGPGKLPKISFYKYIGRKGIITDSKEFLSAEPLVKGDAVALSKASFNIVTASKSNYEVVNVMGFACKDNAGGILTKVRVQTSGEVTTEELLTKIGSEVYLNEDGKVTQNISDFTPTDYLVAVGVALSAHTFLIKIEQPTLMEVRSNSSLMVNSGVVYNQLITKATLDPNKSRVPARLVQFLDGNTISTVDDVLLPDDAGKLITDNSTIDCNDFDN